ncbi:hypothetical protein SAMD00019534_021870 [Acytostelium subglobosum LB1]|uniref:hypothetical protein n=1 Tax=Acytostelium subglobosum LB1 TaxID=1410327 RepID=UPI0006448C15|nr:hypothetical protein SAMD00019534_021870 [Acytostelium subglobosum LB1]GAM19012.1 hypothetical protein SAMD00019534_021870 [Acytostelium subglobosum LB1]|eukprot:XP_012756939.1 hypothetical protein SAMD00019534_021870 [Acytostelium subglobosum LB1]
MDVQHVPSEMVATASYDEKRNHNPLHVPMSPDQFLAANEEPSTSSGNSPNKSKISRTLSRSLSFWSSKNKESGSPSMSPQLSKMEKERDRLETKEKKRVKREIKLQRKASKSFMEGSDSVVEVDNIDYDDEIEESGENQDDVPDEAKEASDDNASDGGISFTSFSNSQFNHFPEKKTITL